MNGDSLDAEREVREALSTAVSSYGNRVLDDPRILGNMVTDLLPNLPRERSLLVTAATAGVAGELAEHVDRQQLSVETAINLVARSLTDNRALDPAASTWVATEYARALGYPVPAGGPGVPPAGSSVPPAGPWIPPTSPQSPPAGPWGSPAGGQAPAAGPWIPGGNGPQVPPGGGIGNGQGYEPTQPTPTFAQGPPPQGPPPQGPGMGPGPAPWPGQQRGGTRPPQSRVALIVGGGVAAIVVLYLIIAAVAHAFPFGQSPTPVVGPTPHVTTHAPTPTPTPSLSASASASASISSRTAVASPSPSLASGVHPLIALLPTDVNDITTQCNPPAAQKWKAPGLVKELACFPADFGNSGTIYGYQMDSYPHYEQAWKNFNSYAIGTSDSPYCPPTKGDSGGPTEWRDNKYPQLLGQVLDCYVSSANQSVYVWTYPSEDAFIITVAPKGWSFATLQAWWKNEV
jgi:hypothetical protein